MFGLLSDLLVPGSLAQRGFESNSHKAFMRMAALASEVFLWAGAYLATRSKTNRACRELLLLLMLCSPLLVLIDHGHFQFNNVVGGLLWLTTHLMLGKEFTLAAVCFTLALNFKQTSLFYSLPVFGYFVGFILSQSKLITNAKQLCYPTATGIFSFFYHCCFYGLVVGAVTALLWMPFITQGSARTVLEAIFPVHRGLYQLKVANFWCVTDPLFKWQAWLSSGWLVTLCSLLTLAATLPSLLCLMLLPKRRTLLLGLFNSALAAFMFGYHMHEKTVLIPLYALLLATPFMGRCSVDVGLAAAFANYHLMKEDGLALQYFCVVPLYYLLARQAITFLQSANIVTPLPVF